MSKPTTHVLMLVDDSGSMARVAADVRGGFNQFLDGLASDSEAKYRVTVGIFGTEYDTLAVAEKPKDVAKLDEKNYRAWQGSTRLYDSVGRIVADFEKSNPNLPKGDKVLMVIQTDGQDNDSREFDRETARRMIETRQSGEVWNVLFLGAGMDGWRAGDGLGIQKGNLFRTENTGAGYAASYIGVTRTAQATARGASKGEVAQEMRAAIGGSDD